MLRPSLASRLKPGSRSFVKCHGSSPTGKMQPAMLFRWLSGIGTRKFSSEAVEASTCWAGIYRHRYCSQIKINYRNALLCEEPAMYMNFIDWMRTTSKKKKKQTYDMYWRRICIYFSLLAEREMSNNVMKQMRRVRTLFPKASQLSLTCSPVHQHSPSR